MTEPTDEEFTPEEEEIIRTAMRILPHVGPDATAQYLDKASTPHEHGEHEEEE